MKETHASDDGAPGAGSGSRGSAPDAAALEVRPPEEEFRLLVQARMEALAKLRASAPGEPTSGTGDDRLDLYAQALERGLGWLEEVRWR